MAFVKLDSAILTSTIWLRRPELEVFLTALLMAEPYEFKEPVSTIEIASLAPNPFIVPPGWYGFVHAAGPGIVRAANVDEKEGMAALEALSQPESESRSQEFDGRRMVRVNGGYVVLNFMRYRDYDHSAKDRMKRLRLRKKMGNGVGVTPNVTPVHPNVTHSRGQKTEGRRQSAECGAEEREANRTLPESLNTQVFRAAWEKWIVHWGQSFAAGRTIPPATADLHLESCRKLGAVAAVSAIENAVARGLREPSEAFVPNGGRGYPAPDKPRIPENLRQKTPTA